ncbi:hypothetical protein H0H81_004773 [Sphagnurus paluster]|uniref:Carboxylic ester hydrolase n=1 Tax=Sphagnurus paluster TaxID=117069 RepID=A0A9P7K275_9AGAR|nr:hypothetical protein H0H81_004773 [Sphagnurus paluster]
MNPLGGGFQVGSTHDIFPNPMLQPPAKPVIFVSFDYRLGQFGFLGGARVKNEGVLNAGLLDQRAALNWVQRYIEEFGGDKSRVTIWGESAGAASTMFQLLGEGGNSKNLFRAAIGDSPSLNFLPSYTDTYVEGILEQFATFAGCGGKGSAVMGCLRAASGDALAMAGSQTITIRTSTFYPFAPIFDDAFLKVRPTKAFETGQFAQVPLLFGYHNPILGSNHGADLGAFFTTSPPSDDRNKNLFASMREYWTSFVVTGRPTLTNNAGLPLWSNVTSHTGSPRIRLEPGNIALEDVGGALAARCAFWKGISEELNV